MKLSLVLLGISLHLSHAPGRSFAEEKRLAPIYAQRDALTGLNQLAVQLMAFADECDRYPTTEEGLAVLIAPPFAHPVPLRWKKILDELPLDPWSNAIHYSNVETEEGVVIRIASLGVDGKPGADDVEVAWSVHKRTSEERAEDLEKDIKRLLENAKKKAKESEEEHEHEHEHEKEEQHEEEGPAPD